MIARTILIILVLTSAVFSQWLDVGSGESFQYRIDEKLVKRGRFWTRTLVDGEVERMVLMEVRCKSRMLRTVQGSIYLSTQRPIGGTPRTITLDPPHNLEPTRFQYAVPDSIGEQFLSKICD